MAQVSAEQRLELGLGRSLRDVELAAQRLDEERLTAAAQGINSVPLIMEIFTSVGMVSKMALKRGFYTLPDVSLETGYDLLLPDVRTQVLKQTGSPSHCWCFLHWNGSGG